MLTGKSITKQVGFVSAVLVILGVYVAIGNAGFILYLKQALGIMISVIAFYLYYISKNRDCIEMFKDYYIVVHIYALVGMVQYIGFFLKLPILYDYSWLLHNWYVGALPRVNSLMREPSFLAISLIPAVYVSLVSLFVNNKFYFITTRKGVVIILACLLTRSSTGFIGIILAFFIIVYRYYNIINIRFKILLVILMVLFTLYIFMDSGFLLRLIDTINVKKTIASGTVNLSTWALYSNFLVVLLALGNTPFFGSGLGTYETVYNNYIGVIEDMIGVQYLHLNSSDAGSLLLRVSAELGLVGLFMLLYFVKKNYCPKSKRKSIFEYEVINNAVFLLIVLRLLRLGHYFIDGLVFFCIVYWSSHEKWITKWSKAK